MLGMISLLAAVIVRYSCSYLDGDDRHGVFLGWLATTIAAVEVLVLAGNLGLLVVAWVATSASLHRLLVFYPDHRRAVVAARKKFVAARVGDGFLVTAAALLYDRFRHRRPRRDLRRRARRRLRRLRPRLRRAGSRLLQCRRHPEVRAIPDARMAGRGHGYADTTVSVESPWEP